MIYAGDIIYRKNLIFNDNQKLDLKLKGHPTLNISYEYNGMVYFLVITSHRRKGHPYYTLNPNKGNRLKKKSYVDLGHIYTEPVKNIIPTGNISEKEYNEIITELEKYHPKEMFEFLNDF